MTWTTQQAQFDAKWNDYYHAACDALGVDEAPSCGVSMAIAQSVEGLTVLLQFGEPQEELLRVELMMLVHPAYDEEALAQLALVAARLVPAVQRTGPTNVGVELNTAEKMTQWLLPLEEPEH